MSRSIMSPAHVVCSDNGHEGPIGRESAEGQSLTTSFGFVAPERGTDTCLLYSRNMGRAKVEPEMPVLTMAPFTSTKTWVTIIALLYAGHIRNLKGCGPFIEGHFEFKTNVGYILTIPYFASSAHIAAGSACVCEKPLLAALSY